MKRKDCFIKSLEKCDKIDSENRGDIFVNSVKTHPQQIYKTIKTKNLQNDNLKQLPNLAKLNTIFCICRPNIGNQNEKFTL